MRVNYQNATNNIIDSIGGALVRYKHITAQNQIAQNTKTTADIQREELEKRIQDRELLAQEQLQKKHPGMTLAEAQQVEAKRKDMVYQSRMSYYESNKEQWDKADEIIKRAREIAKERGQTIQELENVLNPLAATKEEAYTSNPNVIQAIMEKENKWQFKSPYEFMGRRQYDPVQQEQEAAQRLQTQSNTRSYITPTADRLHYVDDNYIQAMDQYKRNLIPKPPTPVSERKEEKTNGTTEIAGL